MNAITDQFAAKTSIVMLDKYRHHMRNLTQFICCTFLKSLVDSRFAPDDPERLVTGSNAEGASLARQFSDDAGTAGETELDIMIVWSTLKSEKCMTYVEMNNAFVHMKVDPLAIAEFTSVLGEETVMKAVCEKADGLYVNGYLIKDLLQQQMAKSPSFLKNMCFSPYTADKECDARSASLALWIDYDEGLRQLYSPTQAAATASADAKGDEENTATLTSRDLSMDEQLAEVNDNAEQKLTELMKQLRPVADEFGVRIEGMLAHVEALQNQFLEMHSGKVSVSLYTQSTKALEWAITCMEVTDYIFTTRESTTCCVVQQMCGATAEMLGDNSWKLCKRRLKFYIDRLMIPEKDFSDPTVATGLWNFLSEMERDVIAPSRFLTAFRELTRLQTTFAKMITFVDENPQTNKVSPELRPIARAVKKLSMDIVPCYKLTFWPIVSGEWKTRDRDWPSQSVIDEIVNKGAHLVAKGYCHDDIDWRLSFSGPEIDLATLWTPAQHFVYFIFKALFYKFIKPVGDLKTADASPNLSVKKYVASYTAKTVMMWTSESFQQSWWTENDAPECLTVLLLALLSAFECRTLTHYFVASVNLLDGVPDTIAERVIDTIQSILADPRAVADKLESHFEKVQIFTDAMAAQQAEIDRWHSHLSDIGFCC